MPPWFCVTWKTILFFFFLNVLSPRISCRINLHLFPGWEHFGDVLCFDHQSTVFFSCCPLSTRCRYPDFICNKTLKPSQIRQKSVFSYFWCPGTPPPPGSPLPTSKQAFMSLISHVCFFFFTLTNPFSQIYPPWQEFPFLDCFHS